MEDRRKIVIPTGAEGAEALETPHFDTEAARAARPVVPLAAQLDRAEVPPRSVHYTQSELPRPTKFSPWLLSLVVLAAMSVGAAGALALDYYRNHKHEEPQAAAAQPTGETVATIDTHPAVKPAEETATVVPAVHPSVNVSKPEASPMPAPSTAAVAPQKVPETIGHTKAPAITQPERPARVDQKQDERDAPSHEARRDRPPRDEESPDVNAEAKRQARRQRRTHDTEVNPNDVPPQLKHATQELHRIREIFEGTRP